MDLAVYLIYATCTVFAIIAAVMLAWSFSAGQWRDLEHASRIVLADDDPYPGGHPAHSNGA